MRVSARYHRSGMGAVSLRRGAPGIRQMTYPSACDDSARVSSSGAGAEIDSGASRCIFPAMPNSKGTIAILTGGGDVPGLNPAIRAITIRALREGYRVVGIRRGWAGLVDYVRDANADNSDNVQELSEADVNRAGRTGGTFLHTSRTRPSHLPKARVPEQLSGYNEK